MGTGAATEIPPERSGELAALVALIAAGDESALARLYDATSRLVYGLALRFVRDSSAAEDVAMEVYLQVWRTAASYSTSRGTVLSWLAMLVRSRSLDWLRSPQGRFGPRIEPLDRAAEQPDSAPDPENISIVADRSQFISRTMCSLPSEQRQAIELAYYSGMSHSDIAAHLGLPLGTVKTRIRMGMSRLRESLAGRAEGML